MIEWYTKRHSGSEPKALYFKPIPFPKGYPDAPAKEVGAFRYENISEAYLMIFGLKEANYLRITRIRRVWYLDNGTAIVGRFKTLSSAKAAAELLV